MPWSDTEDLQCVIKNYLKVYMSDFKKGLK